MKRSPMPANTRGNFSAEKARREAIIWRRVEGARCDICSGYILAALLDDELIAQACNNCPATFAPITP